MPLSVICRNTWIVSFLFLNICKCYFFFLSEKVIFLCKHDVPKLNLTHCLSSLWMLQQRLFHPDIALICSDMEENRNKAVAVPELCCVPWKHCWSSSSLLFLDVFINEGQKSEFFHWVDSSPFLLFDFDIT